MNSFMFGIKIGQITGGGVLAIVLLMLFVYFLATKNRFFTILQEGTYKALEFIGGGAPVFIWSFKGHAVDDEGYLYEKKEVEVVDENGGGKKKKIMWHRNGWGKKDGGFDPIEVSKDINELSERPPGKIVKGFYFTGLHQPHIDEFRWTSQEQRSEKEEGGEIKVVGVFSKKPLDYVTLKYDVYLMIIPGVELRGMVPVVLTMLLTAKIVNLYKPIYRVQKWLETAINEIATSFRPYVRGVKHEIEQPDGKKIEVCGYDFDEMTAYASGEDYSTDEFFKKTQLNAKIEYHWGARITKFGLFSVDPMIKKHAEIAAKPWEAEREVKRLAIEWQRIKDFKDDGRFIKYMETLREMASREGKVVFLPVGDALSLVERWMVGKGGQQ